MSEEFGRDEVEIGVDEDGLYFEAGSIDAAYRFIGLLAHGSEAAIAYIETHIISITEVEVEMENGRGLMTNRVELIHLITNLIESSDITLIEDRDDSSMLAIHIVDGLEDEADRSRLRGVAASDPILAITCPECGATQEGSMFAEVADDMLIRCALCGHEETLERFRVAGRIAGDGTDKIDPR